MTPKLDYGWQGDDPRGRAPRCGKPIVLKGNSVWFRRFPFIETFHMRCK